MRDSNEADFFFMKTIPWEKSLGFFRSTINELTTNALMSPFALVIKFNF